MRALEGSSRASSRMSAPPMKARSPPALEHHDADGVEIAELRSSRCSNASRISESRMLRRSGLETVRVATSAPPARRDEIEHDRCRDRRGRRAAVAHPAISCASTTSTPSRSPSATEPSASSSAPSSTAPARSTSGEHRLERALRLARSPHPAAWSPASAGSSSPASWCRGCLPRTSAATAKLSGHRRLAHRRHLGDGGPRRAVNRSRRPPRRPRSATTTPLR